MGSINLELAITNRLNEYLDLFNETNEPLIKEYYIKSYNSIVKAIKHKDIKILTNRLYLSYEPKNNITKNQLKILSKYFNYLPKLY